MRRTVIAAFIACGCGFGQSTAAIAQQRLPKFEVASVRENAQGELSGFTFRFTPDGGLTARNFSVWNLVRTAYGLRDLQISGGPAWIKAQGFDIEAKPPKSEQPVPHQQTLQMLQALLQERFRLEFHRQTREVPAYALTVAPQGSKLRPARLGQALTAMGNLDAPAMTLASLCQILEFELDRPVVNKTGLDGPYAIQLQWASDRASKELADPTKPSLFTAVQDQLGLRLKPEKAPIEVLVIDRVERPSAN